MRVYKNMQYLESMGKSSVVWISTFFIAISFATRMPTLTKLCIHKLQKMFVRFINKEGVEEDIIHDAIIMVLLCRDNVVTGVFYEYYISRACKPWPI